jgi:3-oxoacyl-[acyl-carrier protein] reductase
MRVALVTGASRGIGRAIAEHLASTGHRVAVNYRAGRADAEEVVRRIGEAGGEAHPVEADVADADAVAAMFADIEERIGPVEVMVNNAGVTDDGLLLRMSPDAWDRVIRTNLTSAYLCTKAALRGMLRARWGRVVSVSSVAGIVGNPGQSSYSAAKAGLIGFTRSVAKEVGSRGITVNVVAPGFIETAMTDSLDPEVRRAAVAAVPLGRFGLPAEVAAAVGYLASDDASYVTGHVLVVDGGMSS